MSTKQMAHLAGLVYFVVVITGIFSLMYVPSTLFFKSDAALTYQKILESKSLYKWSIVAHITCYLAFLFLPLILYRLLHHVHPKAAIAMVTLALVSVPIAFMNLQTKFTVLSFIEGDVVTLGLSHIEPAKYVLFYLDQFGHGLTVVSIFWGLWLLPLGYLIYNSGMLPKVLGVLLMAGCFGYMINIFGDILIDQYYSHSWSKYVSIPASIGEIGTCLWLLIMGVKINKDQR